VHEEKNLLRDGADCADCKGANQTFPEHYFKPVDLSLVERSVYGLTIERTRSMSKPS